MFVVVTAPPATRCSARAAAPAAARPRFPRLLVRQAPAQLPEGSTVHALPVACMARLLAHWDHTSGQVRPARPAMEVAREVDAALEIPAVAEAWLIGRLACAEDMDEVARSVIDHLARQECYGLVRYLLAQGPQHSVAELAARYGLSLAQFHRRCRQVFGHSLKRELRTMRAARALLDYPGRALSLTHLAADHGYASLSHFCTDIKSLIGRTPLSVFRAVTPPAE